MNAVFTVHDLTAQYCTNCGRSLLFNILNHHTSKVGNVWIVRCQCGKVILERAE